MLAKLLPCLILLAGIVVLFISDSGDNPPLADSVVGCRCGHSMGHHDRDGRCNTCNTYGHSTPAVFADENRLVYV